MKTPKERLEDILKHTGENYHSFAKKIGVKPTQTLYDIRDGEIKEISTAICNKITTRYPEFNRIFIIAGEGDMLRNDISIIKTTPDKAFANVYQRMIALEDRVNAYEAILAALMAIHKIDPMEQTSAKEFTEKIELLRLRVSKEADRREAKLK